MCMIGTYISLALSARSVGVGAVDADTPVQVRAAGVFFFRPELWKMSNFPEFASREVINAAGEIVRVRRTHIQPPWKMSGRCPDVSACVKADLIFVRESFSRKNDLFNYFMSV